MKETIVRHGWTARIRYAAPDRRGVSFVALDRGALGFPFWRTQREARAGCRLFRAHKLRAFPVHATLTMTVEDR